MNKCLILIAGPAGSGKTSVLNKALEEDTGFRRLISLTTRAPRSGEVDGVDYHFIGRPEFEAMRDDGMLVEWHEYDGELYGTPVSDIMGDGNAIKIVTAEGARHIISWLERFWDEIEGGDTTILVNTILVLASAEDIECRLADRGCDVPKIGRAMHELRNLRGQTSSFSACFTNENGKIDFSAMILRQWMRYGSEQVEMMAAQNHDAKGGRDDMSVNIHDGSIPLKTDPDNFRQFLCDSSSRDKVHYVTADAKDGTLMGCSCESYSMNPTKNCKHMQAVIEQRYFQI